MSKLSFYMLYFNTEIDWTPFIQWQCNKFTKLTSSSYLYLFIVFIFLTIDQNVSSSTNEYSVTTAFIS